MTPEIQDDFPLFPLNLVSIPHELLPLHIFEERYKVMVAECIEQEREFGIIWLSDEELKGVGCACEVAEVLDRDEEGKLNILIRGTRPFRILERRPNLAYPAGQIEFLDDKEEEPDKRCRKDAQQAYAELVKTVTDRELEDDSLVAMSAYEMAATVDFGLDAKQGLLNLRSENARLRLVARLFRAALKRMELIDLAHARSRSNGKIRFG